jgi:hypothetical protein
MKDLWIRFKQLTGYRGQDIANMTNTSRQHISYITTRESNGITHKSAVVLWMDILIDRKIESLKSEIDRLNQLKTDIRKTVVCDLLDVGDD